MGLGGTAKKLQKVANAAEELYAKMNEVIGQLKELREEVQQTSQQVDQMEYDQAEQRAILDAIAEAEGLDVETILAEADLPPDPADESEVASDEGDDSAQAAAEDETANESSGGDESTTAAN